MACGDPYFMAGVHPGKCARLIYLESLNERGVVSFFWSYRLSFPPDGGLCASSPSEFSTFKMPE